MCLPNLPQKLTQLTNLDLSTCWALGYAEEGWLDDGTPAWVGSDFGPAEQREFAAKEYDWALRPLTQASEILLHAGSGHQGCPGPTAGSGGHPLYALPGLASRASGA